MKIVCCSRCKKYDKVRVLDKKSDEKIGLTETLYLCDRCSNGFIITEIELDFDKKDMKENQPNEVYTLANDMEGVDVAKYYAKKIANKLKKAVFVYQTEGYFVCTEELSKNIQGVYIGKVEQGDERDD